MKIKVVSDIHLEFGCGKSFSFPDEADADILVVAGDVAPIKMCLSEFIWFLDNASALYRKVIFVAGNHEFYNNSYEDTIDQIYNVIDMYHNVHFLNNNHVVTNDVVFIGSTLWTDYNNLSPTALYYAQNNLNDHRVISYGKHGKFTTRDAADLNVSARHFLNCVLKEFNDKRCVVVTHHLPDMICIDDRYLAHGSYINQQLNYAFANTHMQDMILDYNPVLWVHGHTHDSVDIMLGDTRIVCNPVGYMHDLNQNFDNDMVIEV
jgi:Icc-related predicted phosphoesterase